MTPEVAALVDLAEESVEAAEGLFSQGHVRFSVSRAYYAMFYCAEALHLNQGRSFSKHRGVISAFGLHFVKTGLFDRRFHDYLRDAFDDRQHSDYEAMMRIPAETARRSIDRAREFIAATKAFLGAHSAP